MMRLPSFRYRAPRTIAEAVELMADSPESTMLLAGGTDLLPNVKRRHQIGQAQSEGELQCDHEGQRQNCDCRPDAVKEQKEKQNR